MSLHVFKEEPAWLLAYREKNAGIVKSAPLQKSKYSNLVELNRLLEQVPSPKPLDLPVELEKKGVRVLDWSTALQTLGSELRFVLESETAPRDQFEAVVNAHFNSGFVLVIDSNCRVNELLSWQTRLPVGALAKTVLIVKPNCQNVHVLETVLLSDARLNQTVLVQENARVFLARVLESKRLGLLSQQNVLQKDAFLHSANSWVTVSNVRNQTTAILSGSGAQSVQRDFILGGHAERFDLTNWSIHQAPSTVSHSVFKSVLDHQAYCVYEGMIKILRAAQQSTAFLEAYGLLLSDTASNNNIPGLEIEADDVKATHSASVSHVDDEALFYLRSRGVSEKEAKQMIVMGFLESLVHELPESFQEPLIGLLEKKWAELNPKK